MINLLLTMFLLLSSHSAYACYDKGQSDKVNFDNCLAEAQQGNDIAQYNLALMYNDGRGVTQDYKQAVKLYRKAAEQGLASAQFNLGNMYNDGKGVTQDYKQAEKWYRKAAKQGLAHAQGNLGFMYGMGQGVVQDNKIAHMWFNIAATNGNSKKAAKNRDIIAKEMTPSQIEKAQYMAREWVVKHQ